MGWSLGAITDGSGRRYDGVDGAQVLAARPATLGTGELTEREIIQAALKLCVKVDCASAADKTRASSRNSTDAGLYLRTMVERIDDAKQRQIDHDAGDLPEPINVTPAEIRAAEAIERTFIECLTAKDKMRARGESCSRWHRNAGPGWALSASKMAPFGMSLEGSISTAKQVRRIQCGQVKADS